jgi:tetratricopeptide (TPR) repeat protein
MVVQGTAAAVPHWLRAGEIFGELLNEKPRDLGRMRNVALIEKYLGGYFYGKDDVRALAHHTRALQLDEQRVAAEPGNRTAQLDLAIDRASVANQYRALGRLAEAVDFYRRSVEVRRRLSDSDPQDAYARGRLAFALQQLGETEAQLGTFPSALRNATEALQLAEKSAPNNDERRELAQILLSLADIEQRAGRRAEGCAHWQRADALMKRLPPADGSTWREYVGLRDQLAGVCSPVGKS